MNQVSFSQFNLMQNDLKQEDLSQVILLDTASTVNLACNPKLGDQVETSAIKMKLNTNVGSKIVTKRINIPAYDKVWFDEQAITNIFVFYNLAKKYHITYDNNKEDTFLIHLNDGIKKFIPTDNGLCHYHPQKLNPNHKLLQDYNMIQTVRENKRRYSKQDQKRATEAQKLLHVFDGPSERDMRTMLDMNYIKNCPVISKDVMIAQDIFG